MTSASGRTRSFKRRAGGRSCTEMQPQSGPGGFLWARLLGGDSCDAGRLWLFLGVSISGRDGEFFGGANLRQSNDFLAGWRAGKPLGTVGPQGLRPTAEPLRHADARAGDAVEKPRDSRKLACCSMCPAANFATYRLLFPRLPTRFAVDVQWNQGFRGRAKTLQQPKTPSNPYKLPAVWLT